MKITNEILAAYAEGKVSAAERDEVRRYLMGHPGELESVMMMMDEDYELTVPIVNSVQNANFKAHLNLSSSAMVKRTSVSVNCLSKRCVSFEEKSNLRKLFNKETFDSRLNSLVDELF